MIPCYIHVCTCIEEAEINGFLRRFPEPEDASGSIAI
jgi:hypothetical protein